jgi:hypothetical protein
MIIRVLGERQYELPDRAVDRLNTLDSVVQQAVDAGDASAFTDALGRLLAEVRTAGEPVPDTRLTASDLVLPGADSRLADVAALIGDEGLIPD